MAMTTGALSRRSGYTTHAMTLSVAPTLIATHSPWRGDFASRSAAVAPDAGMDAPGCTPGAADVAMSWPACSSTTAAGAECARPAAKPAATATTAMETPAMARIQGLL